jgi:hypothetical protein
MKHYEVGFTSLLLAISVPMPVLLVKNCPFIRQLLITSPKELRFGSSTWFL